MEPEQMKICSSSLLMRNANQKPIRYHLTPVRIACIKKTWKQPMLGEMWWKMNLHSQLSS